MTQYFEDFGSPYTTGGALASDTSNAWTEQKSNATYTHKIKTVSGATAGQALVTDYTSGTSVHTIAVWDTVGGQTGNVEVVCRMKLSASTSSGGVDFLVGPVLWGADNGGVGLRRTGTNSFRLTRWSTTGTAAANLAASFTFADVATDTYFWVRLGRVAGSPDTYRATMWLDADPDPGTWTTTGTDSTYNGLALKPGLGTSLNGLAYSVDPLIYDVVGVGTGTDVAPVADPVANNAPVFSTTISNLTGTEGAAITSVDVSGKWSDADGDPITFTQVGTWPDRAGGGSWVSGAGVISGTPAAGSAGSYTGLYVRGSDGIDYDDSNSFSFTVSAASSNAPTLDAATYPLQHGAVAEFTGTNLSGATVTLDYSTVSEAQTVTTTDTTISIAAVVSNTLPYGSVTVTATTGDGTATLSVTHRPPTGRDYAVIDIPWDADSESIFEGGVAVADGDQVDFETTSQLDVSTLVRGDGTVRVESDTGRHIFQVRLWDESGKVWGALTDVAVQPAGYDPGKPQFIGPNIDDAALTAGDTYSLDVSALFQDTDNDIASYTLVGDWPTWFTWVSADGTGTGFATVGSWEGLQVQATDSLGYSGLSNLFSIVVTRVPGSAVDKFVFRPRTLQSINEGRALRFTVSFEQDGAAFIPDTVRYRVDDEQSGSSVVDWTDVTPADSIVIVLSGDDNQLVSESNRRERRTLTVEADAGTNYAANDYVQFDILNRQGI